MSGSDIPTRSRNLVGKREHGRCARCMGRGAQWHHRRSRRVIDAHRHCPCNGVLLCPTCHGWAHAHPRDAETTGWIVSQWVEEPHSIPTMRVGAWWMQTCEGLLYPLRESSVTMLDGMPQVSTEMALAGRRERTEECQE